MLIKDKITKIFRNTKDKNGNELKTRDGKNYERVAIQINSYGQKWISGFGNSRNANWVVGDSVEVEVSQNGEYLNFSMPKQEDLLKKEIDDLKLRVGKLEELNRKPLENKTELEDIHEQNKQDVEELPF